MFGRWMMTSLLLHQYKYVNLASFFILLVKILNKGRVGLALSTGLTYLEERVLFFFFFAARKMIGWEDVYKVVVAMVPLYVALVLGYGSVRWWKIFTPEQCGAVNKFVCFFTLPLFTFEFTAHVDPFKMNYLFIGADAISKLIIVVVLGFWANCSSKGSYTWSITSFSLCSLTNSLVVGVPLMKAMYGQMAVDLVVQSSVIQSIIWLTVLLFVLEFRRSRLDVSSCNNTDTDNLQKDLEGSNCSVDHNNSNRPASFWVLMKVVWIKLAMNPNLYACIIALFLGFYIKQVCSSFFQNFIFNL